MRSAPGENHALRRQRLEALEQTQDGIMRANAADDRAQRDLHREQYERVRDELQRRAVRRFAADMRDSVRGEFKTEAEYVEDRR